MNVRDATYEILRKQGMTTIFGNPGSNELTFLADFPSDFRYILGLHEGVAVGMADGYSQATGRPALVNLHAAAGTGNGMGALVNAYEAHSPLVVMAGQQVRAMFGMDPLLTITDSSTLPLPLVKRSYQPSSAQDVPLEMSRAIRMAALPCPGPVFLSVPLDDWSQEADPQSAALATRVVKGAGSADEETLNTFTERLQSAKNPALVLGPEVDTPEASADAVTLAEKLKAPVWIGPSASRCPFPVTHPQFAGLLPAAIAGISQLLNGHDLIVVFGAPVFRYHQYDPGSYLPPNASLVAVMESAEDAAHAPVGDAIVGDVAGILKAVANRVAAVNRSAPKVRTKVPPGSRTAKPIQPETVFDVLAAIAPRDAIYVDESTSTTEMMFDRLPLGPRGYWFGAGGGLGYAMPVALGVQLAYTSRRVIAVIGDGSANYSITSLWTAAKHKIPVTFLILKNGIYGVLMWFAKYLRVGDLPGMDVSGIDFVSVARGYGVEASHAESAEEIEAALKSALSKDTPQLIEIPTAVEFPPLPKDITEGRKLATTGV